MKKIIPFEKDLLFKTSVNEITAISLEHNLDLSNEDTISGNFIITGEYKITEASIQKESFSFELPFDIALGTRLNTKECVIDIDDFNYKLKDSNTLYVKIDLYIEGEEEPIPEREVDITSVRYAANRADDVVKFSDDALQMLVKVPRPFLKLVLKGCVSWAKENNCTLITAKEMKIINDKRSKEKQKK